MHVTSMDKVFFATSDFGKSLYACDRFQLLNLRFCVWCMVQILDNECSGESVELGVDSWPMRSDDQVFNSCSRHPLSVPHMVSGQRVVLGEAW